MLDFWMFLNQQFGDGGRWEDHDARSLDWPIALMLCLLAVAGVVYLVFHLWLTTP